MDRHSELYMPITVGHLQNCLHFPCCIACGCRIPLLRLPRPPHFGKTQSSSLQWISLASQHMIWYKSCYNNIYFTSSVVKLTNLK